MSANPQTAERVLTVKQAADLGYGGMSTIRRAISTGELIALQRGPHCSVRIPESNLVAWVAGKRPMADDEALTPEERVDDVLTALEAAMEAAAEEVVAKAPQITPERKQRLHAVLDRVAAVRELVDA